MSIISKTEFDRQIIESIINQDIDERIDHEGKIIIHTGMYKWHDGTIRDEVEVRDDRVL
jgi:hypothetical protein